MVEGVSGLLSVHGADERPQFEPSLRRVVWPNGTVAEMFSAEQPDGLRGPQFDVAWCDELAKWRHPQETWDMLQFGLRLGEAPKVVVTTTPRPMPLLQRLVADADTLLARTPTLDNVASWRRSSCARSRRATAAPGWGGRNSTARSSTTIPTRCSAAS